MLSSGAGYLGIVLFLGAYLGLQLRFLSSFGYAFATLNLVATLLVLFSLQQTLVLDATSVLWCWVVISLMGIARTYLINRKLAFTDEEKLLIEKRMSKAPREFARRLFDAGNWLTIEPYIYLTREGRPVEYLYYLTGGRAEVSVGKTRVAEVNEGLIGEIHVLSGDAASASVQTQERIRAFCISGENLRHLRDSDPQAGLFIEQLLAASTQEKLMSANQRMSGGR